MLDRFNDIWENFYQSTLNEIRLAKNKADLKNLFHHKGLLLATEALTLLALTDYFDDVPYSDSFKGINNPKYDSQIDIFKVIYSNLDHALELLNGPVGDVAPSSEDVFFQGDISKWIKTVHAIKARALLHEGKYSEALVEADLGMQSVSDNLNFQYENEINSAWYYRFNRDRTGDLEFHPTMRALMSELNDLDRLELWDQTFRTTHPYFVADQVVELLTYREMEFIKAECQFRLNGPSQNVLESYHNGILSSFELLGFAEGVGQNYIGQSIVTPNIQNLDLEYIMTQKYIALFAQPEVWSDWRRTAIPELTPVSGNKIPVRFQYPADEYLYNENAPVESTVNIFTDRVGWNR